MGTWCPHIPSDVLNRLLLVFREFKGKSRRIRESTLAVAVSSGIVRLLQFPSPRRQRQLQH